MPNSVNSSFKSATEAFHGALSLPCHFEPGTYIIRIRIENNNVSSKNSMTRAKHEYQNPTPYTTSPMHDVSFTFLSFDKGFSRKFVDTPPTYVNPTFKVEPFNAP